MHISPLNPRVFGLWSYAMTKMLRMRIPIAERAAAARPAPLAAEQLRDLIARRQVVIGANSFRLCQSPRAGAERQLAVMVSQLAPVLDRTETKLWVKDSREIKDGTRITAWTARPGVKHGYILCLTLDLGKKELYLQSINSWQKGLGGKALVAVYNIARQLMLGKITFDVNRDNLFAQYIYYHLDFGRPTDLARTRWEVAVK